MNTTFKKAVTTSIVVVLLGAQMVSATGYERWSKNELETYNIQIAQEHNSNINLYKVVMLTKGVMSGYGTGETNKHIDGVDEYIFLYPLYVGLPQLAGNEYKFKENNRPEVDILKTNTVIEGKLENKKGMYWLNEGQKLTEINQKKLAKAIELEYPREIGYKDELYMPYASAIAITEIQKGMNDTRRIRAVEAQSNFIDSVGIGESKAELERHLRAIITVTQRYGVVSQEETADILRYYIMMWRESSTKDSNRSFLNYKYGKGQNYTEEYKNKCLYGYGTLEGYMEGGPEESRGNLYKEGKYMGTPLFTEIIELPEMQDIKERIQINKEHGFKEAIELYNVGITAILTGQQTMTEIQGSIEKEKTRVEIEAQRASQVERVHQETEKQQAVERERRQTVTRGAELRVDLSGEAISKLNSGGKIYKPMKLITEGLEKRVDLTYFVQTHGEWAQERIRDEGGYASTYSMGACGYTSMAMLIASINEDKDFTPLTLKPTLQYNVSGNNIVVPHVGYSHGGMEWYINNIGLQKEVVTSKNGVTYGSGTMVTQSNVRNLIDNGGVGILSTSNGSPYTGAGHMVLLVGYTTDEKGNFKDMIIQDPNLLANLNGRFTNQFKSRITVNRETGLIYDNFMSNYKSVPQAQMRFASAVFLK